MQTLVIKKLTEENALKLLYVFTVFHIIIAVIFACVSQTIWLDEAYTLTKLRMSYTEITSLLANYDSHVPFYFYITKFVVDTVTGIFPEVMAMKVARVVSVVPMVLMVILSATKVSHNWGKMCGALFAFCVSAMPQMLNFAVEIRMYSWCMFFILLAFLSAYDCAIKGTIFSWIILALSSAAACYTHYYGAVSAVLVYVALFIWSVMHKRHLIKWWLVSGCAVAAIFAPWLGFALSTFSKASKADTWIPTIGVRELIGFVEYPFHLADGRIGSGFGVILAVACMAVLVVYFYQSRKKGFDKERLFFAVSSLTVMVGTVAVGCIVSWLVSPFFIARYMAQTLPLCWLCFALLCTEDGKFKYLNHISALMIVFVTFANIVTFVRFEYQDYRNYEGVNTVLGQIEKKDIIITDFFHLRGVLEEVTTDTQIYFYEPGIKEEPTGLSRMVWPTTIFVGNYTDIPEFSRGSGDVYVALDTSADNLIEFEEFIGENNLTPASVEDGKLEGYNFRLYVFEKE